MRPLDGSAHRGRRQASVPFIARRRKGLAMIADRMLAQIPTKQTVNAGNTLLDADAARTIDRRAEQPRYRFPRPFVVIPVLPDGAPDLQHRVIGVSADITADGEWEFPWENAADL